MGVIWHPTNDCLLFDVSSIAQLAATIEPTKWNIISVIGRFYDPLGFFTRVTIRFKIFFQRLCDEMTTWDEPLNEVLSHEWNQLIEDLCGGTTVSIPRSYLAGMEAVILYRCLCGFCDASERAYAAVIYLVQVTEDRTVTSFVAAKTRVAPLHRQTIPRLELLSALLLSRLMRTVASSLQYLTIELKCFTDSQIALYWIKGVDKEWKPFVQNRTTEIRQAIPLHCWSHCPGETNPADLPTRGLSLLELSVNRLWHHGPEWLSRSITLLGEDPLITTLSDEESHVMPHECMLELKTKSQLTHSLLAVETRPAIGEVIDLREHSSLPRLFRVTAYHASGQEIQVCV